MNLFTYWEGPRNPFIDTCLASMKAVCTDGTEFHLVTPENFREYVGDDLHPDVWRIKTTHGCSQIPMRAGAMRAAILYRHGGMYWDADTIGLRNPAELVNRYEDFQYANKNLKEPPVVNVLYATWDRPPLRTLNGYVYARQGCVEARDWLASVNARIELQQKQPVGWTEMGEKLLTPILVKSPAAWRVPREMFLPIDVDSCVERFFTDEEWFYMPEVESVDPVCFGMNYSYFEHHHPKEMKLSPSQWGKSPLLIHRLLEYARNPVCLR